MRKQWLNPNPHTWLLYSMHFVVRHKYSSSECSVRIVWYGKRFWMPTTATVNDRVHYAIPQCNRSLVTNEEEMADPTPPERRCRKRRKKETLKRVK
jgi:hypothetical protein